MKKIVVFGDRNSFITSILFDEVLRYNQKLFEIVAVVDTNANSPKNNIFKLFGIYIIKKIFNPSQKIDFNTYKSFLCKTSNCPLFTPENVNDIYFIDELKKLNPTYALSLGNPQIMKKGLIEVFHKIINYHNSVLPEYRGLNATAWAMTFNQKYTGYTFHEINEKIDEGKIYIQEKFEIDYSKTIYELEVIKTKMACRQVVKLFELLTSGFDGFEQIGKPSYYGNLDKKKLLTYKNLNDVKTIRKLIQVWSGIYFKVNNKEKFVTSIDFNGHIERIKWLPVGLYNFVCKIKTFIGEMK